MVSDMFFSLWTNTYPEQMPNNLVPIDIEGGEVGWSRGVDQWTVVYGNILDGVRKLYDNLVASDPLLLPDPFPLATPPPESHTRAPCANDGCLFVTSLTPFPHPSSLRYDEKQPKRKGNWKRGWWSREKTDKIRESAPSFDPWSIQHVREHEAKYNEYEGGWPEDRWWTEKGSWHLAVDGRGLETCWESWQPPQESEYFGLTFVAPRLVEEIKIVGSHDLGNVIAWRDVGSVPDAWELLTESRRLAQIPSVRNVSPRLVEVTLRLEPVRDFYGAPLPIRKLKFLSRGKKRWKLAICSWELDGWKI